MKILVTGGAGFIGTNLIKRLLQDGHEVISIDNYNTGLKENHQEGCEYLEHDIRSITSYNFINPDVVFHMAAIARIQPSFKNPIDYFTTNANGTLNLVNWCAENNVSLIYAGSSSKHSGRFKNPYTFSKDIGEDIIELYKKHYYLSTTITRFYNVYGPYQLTEGGYTTLIGRWLNNIKNGIQCEIYGDGEQRRDFTHVDDIIDALVAIMDGNHYGWDFELGRGKNISVNEVAKMMDITPVYKDSKPGEARHTLNIDNTAYDVLDWEPKINLEEYLKK
jgi:UDP-glucose 4-epimerase|tara:strand:+ start:2879 stop:3709 length:831 start_codon:yes stop_codon:yes gene_type:complete